MKAELETLSFEQLQRAYELQKKAREKADQLLEEKSRELYLRNQSLSQTLEQLHAQQAKLVMQEKLASVGQVGASLAHELNNPNAFIQNNLIALKSYTAQLAEGLNDALSLLSQTAHSLDDVQAKTQLIEATKALREKSDLDYIEQDVPALVDESLQGTQRISNIANSLRYFANPDQHTAKPIDLNECVENALSLVHKRDKLAQIHLDLSSVDRITGQPLLLSQAIANLIQNAVETNCDRPEVSISTHQDEGSIQIDIVDQGPGVDQNTVSELFKPFYTTKNGQNGLGLGIAKQIIEQHQGSMSITSSVAQGTRVTIKLPKTKNALSHQQPARPEVCE